MGDIKDLIKARDLFKEMAGIIDELIELNKRIENGEDVEKELESLFGKFAIKLIALKSLEDQMERRTI